MACFKMSSTEEETLVTTLTENMSMNGDFHHTHTRPPPPPPFARRKVPTRLSWPHLDTQYSYSRVLQDEEHHVSVGVVTSLQLTDGWNKLSQYDYVLQ